jgi:hypothetical protein
MNVHWEEGHGWTRSNLSIHRRTYVKFVRCNARSGRWVAGVSQNSLLQEILSHNVDENAAKGKRKPSRSRCS